MPIIQVPDVMVNEGQGIAEICIEIGNQIENSFTVTYTTAETPDGASGKSLPFVHYISPASERPLQCLYRVFLHNAINPPATFEQSRY